MGELISLIPYFKLSKPENAKEAFWLAFVLCVLVGLFIIFVITPLTGLSQKFGGSAHDGYLEIARNIMEGNGYVFKVGGPPVLHRPPLYPFFLVPLTLLPAYLQRPILVLLQSAMVGCIGYLIFRIAQRLFSITIARLSVFIFLINPWVYWLAKNPMSIVLQGFLYILFISLIGREVFDKVEGKENLSINSRVWSKQLYIGIVVAALALTHGTMIFIATIALLMLFFNALLRRNFRDAINIVIISFIILLFISPWTYRNWQVFHRFVPITGNAGFTYFAGNAHWGISGPQQKNDHDLDTPLEHAGIEGKTSLLVQFWGLTDPEIENRTNKRMIEHMRTHTTDFIKKIYLNSIEFYFPIFHVFYSSYVTESEHSFILFNVIKYPEKLILSLFYFVIWGLGGIGIWRWRKQKKMWFSVPMILLPIFFYSIPYFPFLVFVGHSQYTFGTVPFLSILVASAFSPSSFNSKTER